MERHTVRANADTARSRRVNAVVVECLGSWHNPEEYTSATKIDDPENPRQPQEEKSVPGTSFVTIMRRFVCTRSVLQRPKLEQSKK